MVQHGLVVETLIAEMRSSVAGELTSRSKVVDDLLDLRLAARNRTAMVVVIDRLLSELPGRTTVPNAWWLAGLVELERAGVGEAVASAAPAVTGPEKSVPPPLPRRRPTS